MAKISDEKFSIVREEFLVTYMNADSSERFDIVIDNFSVFPKIIRKMKKKIEYKIKSEREYSRGRNKGSLGIRVQTSVLSNTTQDEAIANVTLEEAFDTGNIDTSILSGIDNVAEYRDDIRTINVMKDDYELIQECIEDLEDSESKLLKGFLSEKKYYKELACEFGISYDSIRRKISKIKADIKEEVTECMKMNCRSWED